jgi:hypothetical protein
LQGSGCCTERDPATERSWQIVPTALPRLLAHEEPAVAGRVFAAMSAMVKIDIAGLERAAKGHS